MGKKKQIQWECFEIQEIFDIVRGNAKDVTRREFGGNVALVSATNKNNGVYDFVTPKSDETIYSNTMTIHNNGNVGLVFYHNYNFIATSDVTILIDKTNKIDKEVAEFIITSLQQQKEKYCYGYKLSNQRLKKQKILLPIKKDGDINFEFIKDYIKTKKRNIKEKYEKNIAKEVEYLKKLNLVMSKDIKWEEFYIKDIFSMISRGKRLKKEDHIVGDIPYVSSTMNTNGVDGFIGNDNGRTFYDCLSLANSGSVGSCFYHEYTFIGSDHITALKNEEYNKWIYLFLATSITRIKDKYSFNREINDSRIKKEKILLPIKENEKINFTYMENYIKKITLEKLNDYIQFNIDF